MCRSLYCSRLRLPDPRRRSPSRHTQACAGPAAAARAGHRLAQQIAASDLGGHQPVPTSICSGSTLRTSWSSVAGQASGGRGNPISAEIGEGDAKRRSVVADLKWRRPTAPRCATRATRGRCRLATKVSWCRRGCGVNNASFEQFAQARQVAHRMAADGQAPAAARASMPPLREVTKVPARDRSDHRPVFMKE